MIGFFEAFPELSVDDKMYDMFAGVQVEKVNASKTKMLALIHCTSDQLLHYRTLKNMEYKLYRQIFRSIGVNPHLEISYPYTESLETAKIIEQYGESMQEELREKNKIEYMKFCSHPMEVKGDEIRITCDDDFLCHKLSGEIEEYFEGMMRKRFNRSVKICFNYVEKAKRTPKQPEVYTVIRPNEQPEAEIKETPKKKFVPQKSNKKRIAKDPGVFYGNHVMGERIPIKEIVDEIGEVVIEGKILNVEKREISNGEKYLVTFSVTDYTDTIMCKIFVKVDLAEELSLFEMLAGGNNIRARGEVKEDKYDNGDLSIMVYAM